MRNNLLECLVVHRKVPEKGNIVSLIQGIQHPRRRKHFSITFQIPYHRCQCCAEIFRQIEVFQKLKRVRLISKINNNNVLKQRMGTSKEPVRRD